MAPPLRYHKNLETFTAEENFLLEKAKKSIADFVEASAEISNVHYATRNAHAKTYAVMKGELIIENDFPPELKSVFDFKKYNIIVRLSNANLKINKKSRDIPAYGFAIKLKDENGETIANFPLVNFPLFPINSVSVFLKLFTAVNRFFLKKWSSIFLIVTQIIKIIPSTLNFSFLKNVLKLILNKNKFVLSFNFHSVGAYRLGDNMVKIKVIPKNVPQYFNKNLSVKQSVENYFSSNAYVADVFVQFCYDLENQPINKLNVEWKNSPLIRIGEIRIDEKSLFDPDDMENELLSFNPYESREIFQPVGKIQKLRDEAYKVSLKIRTKINNLMNFEN